MRRNSAILVGLLAAAPARGEEPLSAIDWLRAPAPIEVAQPMIRPLAAPERSGATVPDVAVMPLGEAQSSAVGLLPTASTGLPQSLWQASTTDILVTQMSRLQNAPLPGLQALYYTLLLAEADAPATDADADADSGDARFLKARIETLRRYGAVDAALALIERAGPATPELFETWFDLALLNGAEDAPCAALAKQPDLSSSYAARVYCIARMGDWSTAALTYDGAAALGALERHEEALLAPYLDPETAQSTGDLAPPREMTPLIFRLYEAAGQPLPTGSLPREYAVADLRGTMGWRAEIEAAERLARSGALPANRLFGLYTERRPAASGGVWSRVRAVQRFDAAVEARDPDAMRQSLPGAWEEMTRNGLAVVFAAYYGDVLVSHEMPADDPLALEVALLSPDYEAAAALAEGQTGRTAFLTGLAQGTPDEALAKGPVERAIAQGFAATKAPEAFSGPLEAGRLGQVILAAAHGLDTARTTRTGALVAGLATLRAVGLEDVARRTALQILLLDGRA